MLISSIHTRAQLCQGNDALTQFWDYSEAQLTDHVCMCMCVCLFPHCGVIGPVMPSSLWAVKPLTHLWCRQPVRHAQCWMCGYDKTTTNNLTDRWSVLQDRTCILSTSATSYRSHTVGSSNLLTYCQLLSIDHSEQLGVQGNSNNSVWNVGCWTAISVMHETKKSDFRILFRICAHCFYCRFSFWHHSLWMQSFSAVLSQSFKFSVSWNQQRDGF